MGSYPVFKARYNSRKCIINAELLQYSLFFTILVFGLSVLFVVASGSNTLLAANKKFKDKQHPSANVARTQSKRDKYSFTIQEAVMCEDIENMEPVKPSIVFPVEIGEIICYTAISNISEQTYLIHRWIHKDEIITTKRLKIKPPYWRTYSKIQLRETDKGPWRVEISNLKGKILKVLRFSITD